MTKVLSGNGDGAAVGAPEPARVWGLRPVLWCAIGSRAALLAVGATAIYLALAVAAYLAYPTRFFPL